MALPFTPTFPGAYDVPLPNPPWTQMQSTMQIKSDGSGHAFVDQAFANIYAFDNSNVYPADQYAQGRIVTFSINNAFCQVIVRASGVDGTMTHYALITDGSANGSGYGTLITATKNNANVGTLLTLPAIPWVVGDVMKLGVVGTTLTAYRNGVAIGTATDSQISAGSAGIGMTWLGNSAPTMDLWEGGSLAGAAPTTFNRARAWLID